MEPYRGADLGPTVASLASDGDTSEVAFVAATALEANQYEKIRAIAVVYKDASNADNTVTITFLSKATADGAVGTWTTVQAEAAVAIADAAGFYSVAAEIDAREFGEKFANASATLALTDPDTDTVVVGLILEGISPKIVPALSHT